MTDKLLITQDEQVLTLSINRPQVRNAVDPETMTALQDAVQKAGTDDSVRVIVITGEGGAFCSGADIQGAMQSGGDLAENAYKTLTEVYGPTMLAIRDCPKPIIAAVEGYAAGIGCDLALRCDMRVMSDTAKFAELFVRVGLIPDGGGTYMLPRLVGLGRAMEIMFSGRSILADEALRIGLANHVYPEATFKHEMMEFAIMMTKQSPLALQRGKKAMIASLESTFEESLLREATLQRELFSSEDGAEGFMAFLEKRQPNWKGR